MKKQIKLLEIAGLGAIVDRYRGFICDLWGVIHNGVAPYPGAIDALMLAADRNLPLIFVSNAPRPPDAVAAQLARLGIDPHLYAGIVTSGQATQMAIRDGRFGKRFWHLGPERDRGLFDNTGIQTAELDQADAIACTGLFDDDVETPQDYVARLESARAHNLPFICANPDLEVIRGSKPIPCAGALARLYESMGGQVHYFGKPHVQVFEIALAQLNLDREQVLVIGDGLRTDIRGAANASIDSWLIAGGIHAAELGAGDGPFDLDQVMRVAQSLGGNPAFVSSRFTA